MQFATSFMQPLTFNNLPKNIPNIFQQDQKVPQLEYLIQTSLLSPLDLPPYSSQSLEEISLYKLRRMNDGRELKISQTLSTQLSANYPGKLHEKRSFEKVIPSYRNDSENHQSNFGQTNAAALLNYPINSNVERVNPLSLTLPIQSQLPDLISQVFLNLPRLSNLGSSLSLENLQNIFELYQSYHDLQSEYESISTLISPVQSKSHETQKLFTTTQDEKNPCGVSKLIAVDESHEDFRVPQDPRKIRKGEDKKSTSSHPEPIQQDIRSEGIDCFIETEGLKQTPKTKRPREQQQQIIIPEKVPRGINRWQTMKEQQEKQLIEAQKPYIIDIHMKPGDITQQVKRTSIGENYQAVISQPNKSKQRNLRLKWNPESLDERILEEYEEKIGHAVGETLSNREKIICLLMEYQLNIQTVLNQIEKNRLFYQNYFKVNQRNMRRGKRSA